MLGMRRLLLGMLTSVEKRLQRERISSTLAHQSDIHSHPVPA